MTEIYIVHESAPQHEGYYYIIGSDENAPQDGPFLTADQAHDMAVIWMYENRPAEHQLIFV